MTPHDEIADILRQFEQSSRNEWGQTSDAAHAKDEENHTRHLEGGDVERATDARATWYAELSAYLFARSNGSTHEKALEKAMAQGRRIRKALGYNS
jgi:hypothetical protein